MQAHGTNVDRAAETPTPDRGREAVGTLASGKAARALLSP